MSFENDDSNTIKINLYAHNFSGMNIYTGAIADSEPMPDEELSNLDYFEILHEFRTNHFVRVRWHFSDSLNPIISDWIARTSHEILGK